MGLEFQLLELPFAVLPIPAAVDWTRQTSRGVETTNVRRAVTGTLFGLATGDFLFLASIGVCGDLEVGAIIALAYVGLIAYVVRRPPSGSV